METYDTILKSAETKFSKVVKKPERFLQTDVQLFQELKLLSKVMYDVGKITEPPEHDQESLPELIIDHFDEEQVWAGIDIHNQNNINKWRRKMKNLKLDDKSSIFLKAKNDKEVAHESDLPLQDHHISDEEELQNESNKEEESALQSEDGDNISDVEEEDIMNDPDFQNMSDSEGDDLPLFDNLSEDDKSDQEAEGTYRAKEKRMAREKTEKEVKGRTSEVDDKFFKLRDMEKFLEKEDRREEGKDLPEDEDDEDIDLFDDVGDEDDSAVMYSQYFNENDEGATDENLKQRLSQQNVEEDEDEELDSESKMEEDAHEDELEDQNQDEEEDASDNEESEDDDAQKNDLLQGSSDSEQEFKVPQSTHEKSQAKLQSKIESLEENAVGDKPWQLGGEVAALVRPENSLLAEDLDYVSGVRAAPVITEAVARKLEDIILQRIKDQAWDDVERKVKPIESAQEYKKKLVLDQEKSKLSLAQVYEEEYLRISQAQEKQANTPGLLDKDVETLPLEVKRIKEDMRSLFAKLDTLTHSHYTPKLKSTELKIVRNVASIAMEEVAPVGASNATLLAPAEVVDKSKGELMTDADKTKTDRKRERRQKKAKIRAKLQDKAKKEKSNENGPKQSTKKDIENAEKQGKLKTVKEKDKNHALKSSTAFFDVLQDEVKSTLKDSSNKSSKKKNDKKISLSALKL